MSLKATLRTALYEAQFLAQSTAHAVVYVSAFLLIIFGIYKMSHKNDIIASSAMITNMDRNSGGSGIILESSYKESIVLTNEHVCNVTKNGGFVSNNDGKSFLVHSYKASATQDLCLIKVLGDLGASTEIASKAPTLFYDSAKISGHPTLLPTVVTTGHFSGRQSIQVMTGLKPCTKEDESTLGGALICMILGGMPILKEYDTVLVTATIMPGSSGSGVFNSHNQLAGVVFAGSGNLGYASTIPYENMMEFLNVEQQTLAEQFPNDMVNLFPNSHQESFEKARKFCATPFINFFKDICDLLNKDAVWRK